MNFPVLIKSFEIEILHTFCLRPVDELPQVASLIRRTRHCRSIGWASRGPSRLADHNLFIRKLLLELCILLIEEAYGSVNGYLLPERIDVNSDEINSFRQLRMLHPLHIRICRCDWDGAAKFGANLLNVGEQLCL